MTRRKWLYVTLGVILLLSLSIGAILALADADYPIQAYYPGDLMDKMHTLEAHGGGEMQLNQDAVNQLLAVFLERFKKGVSVPGLQVKGLNAEVEGSQVTLYLPVSYRGTNVLLAAQGSMSMTKDNVIFNPVWFKAGRLPVSKTMALGLLHRHTKGDTKVVDHQILLPKTILPFTLSSLTVQDSTMHMYIEPLAVGYIFKPNAGSSSGSAATKPPAQQSTPPVKTSDPQQSQPQVTPAEPASSSIRPQSGPSATNSNPPTVTPPPTPPPSTPSQGGTTAPKPSTPSPTRTKEALTQLIGELNVVSAELTTAGQKQIISLIQASVNQTIADPSYNFIPDAEYVRKLYYKLPDQERTAIKLALLSNVDPQLILELRNTFGI